MTSSSGSTADVRITSISPVEKPVSVISMSTSIEPSSPSSRGRLILGVERVELLVEPMFGGDAGIDRTADRLGRRGLHGRPPVAGRSALSRSPKNHGPFHLVPVIAKATLVMPS